MTPYDRIALRRLREALQNTIGTASPRYRKNYTTGKLQPIDPVTQRFVKPKRVMVDGDLWGPKPDFTTSSNLEPRTRLELRAFHNMIKRQIFVSIFQPADIQPPDGHPAANRQETHIEMVDGDLWSQDLIQISWNPDIIAHAYHLRSLAQYSEPNYFADWQPPRIGFSDCLIEAFLQTLLLTVFVFDIAMAAWPTLVEHSFFLTALAEGFRP